MNLITIKGYHGTDSNSCRKILHSNYKISEGDEHWLGDGVYFFVEGISTSSERTIKLAEKWAIVQSWDNVYKEHKYTDYVVMESQIRVDDENFLDLTKEEGVEILFYLAKSFQNTIKNSYKKKNKKLLFFDGLLINLARKYMIFSFEVIKGNFNIKFKEERINKINLRTNNCTICTVYFPEKNIISKEIIKKGGTL